MSDDMAWQHDIEALINKDGRVNREARMLAKDGSLSDAERTDIGTRVKQYIDKNGITQAQVARQIGGLSASNVSAILSGVYKHGKLDDHLRSLNDWMEVDARRRATKPDNAFVETDVAKRLMGAAHKVVEHGCLGIAYGPSGVGKTMVAHVIAEKFPGTLYIMAGEGLNNYMSVRRAVANALRLFSGRTAARQGGTPLNERIIDRLRHSGRLILIDEGHQLNDAALNYLRTLHDQCGVPILLLCTKDLLDRVRRDNDEDHGQLYSRVGYVCDLTRGRDKVPRGKKPLFTIREIRALFEDEQIRLAPDAQGYLQDVANKLGQGSIRRCKWIMRWAVMIERVAKGLGPKDKMVITAALLEQAETQPMADDSMLDDIRVRAATVAARSA